MLDHARAKLEIVAEFNRLSVHLTRIETAAQANPKDFESKRLAEELKNLASKFHGKTKEVYGRFK